MKILSLISFSLFKNAKFHNIALIVEASLATTFKKGIQTKDQDSSNKDLIDKNNHESGVKNHENKINKISTF